MPFTEITELASVSFEKVKWLTDERYKFFTQMQESLEAFHAALTAQAARSELGTLESEIVRDTLAGYTDIRNARSRGSVEESYKIRT